MIGRKWMPFLLSRSIKDVFAKAAPGVKTPPLIKEFRLWWSWNHFHALEKPALRVVYQSLA